MTNLWTAAAPAFRESGDWPRQGLRTRQDRRGRLVGDTAFTPRKFSGPLSRSLSLICASMRPRHSRRGSTGRCRGSNPAAVRGASMRPRHSRRGSTGRCRGSNPAAVRGASMRPRHSRRGTALRKSPTSYGFNEATAFTPRKYLTHPAQLAVVQVASMRPRHSRRGSIRRRRACRLRGHRFNEATAFTPRKYSAAPRLQASRSSLQ